MENELVRYLETISAQDPKDRPGVIDVSVIQKAYSQVLNFAEKDQKEKNSKLAFRYTLLRNYFEARLPLWEDLFSKKQ